MGRYALVSEFSIVENIVLWDGVTEYNPGEGISLLHLEEDSPIDIGDTIPE